MSIFGTGFGQNPQQQQQQQQQQPQPNAFGQPSSFGGSGFGAFGQNTQQQPPAQQQANPMFGNLSSSTSAPATGFGVSPSIQPTPSYPALSTPRNATGAFGSASSSSNAFGQPKPPFGSTSGTTAFGSTQPSAFGTGGAFGSAGTSGAFGASGSGGGAVFGQPTSQQQQNAFSGAGGGGLFGKTPGSAFGSTALVTTTVPTTGSANPPYQEFQERDQTGAVPTMLHFQSISCMPAYRNASFEELRVVDYQQGRKTANTFGNPTPAFGQQAQAQQPTTGLFGQAPSTGAFGQQQPTQPAATGFGAFGQQQQPQPPSAFGAFGQQQPSTGGFGTFGQPQQPQQQPASTFGAFGQQSLQPQQQGSGFGAFGQQTQQNKGFGQFGQPQASTTPFSAFGSGGGTTAPASGSSLFGQPQQTQPSSFGAFGQQSTQANQQQGTSLLKPSIFGQPSTGGGLFGNTGQQQGGGLFGNPGQQQPQQGVGLFGQQTSGTGAFGQPAQQSQQPNLFGQPATGGGLFGGNQQQQAQTQQSQQAPGGGFSSFFSKPPGGGLFSSTTTPQNQQQNPNPSNPLFGVGGGTSLFGNTNTQQQPQQTSTTNPLLAGGGGSLFGGKPPAPAPGFPGLGSGLFGNTQQQQVPSQGGGLFGSTGTQQGQQQSSLFGGGSSLFSGSTQQQQSQPGLTASIDQPLPSQTSAPIPQLPSFAFNVSPKKKSNVFARLGLNYTPPGSASKLRGFRTSVSISNGAKTPFSLPPLGSPGKHGLPLSEGKSLLPPGAFSSGTGGNLPLLGGARQSVKKLVLDRPMDEEELHRLRTTQSGEGTPAKSREVKFSPALSVAAREKENEPSRSTLTPAPTRPALRPTSKYTDGPNVSSTAKYAGSGTASSSTPLDPQEGEYWCLPTVAELQRLSFTELQAVADFTVGRVGFGTIQFLEPVDLTSVPSIADIPGKIVTFEHVECTVYVDERLKPPPGEGLNVPARIKLDRCWALDKSTREPIKDPNDPKHQQRLRRMQAQEGAKFIGFEMETGVWEFTVQEF